MEKFAVDLDKVLDDFEFNEDCAEQIASINSPSNNASASGAKCNLDAPKNYNYLGGDRQAQSIDIRSPMQSRLPLVYGNPNYLKSEPSQDTGDCVNHYHVQDYASDAKLTQKQAVPPYESEPASLTIHNDISHRFLQKQQNGGSPKIDNRYDKKLNQPSSKPSVSNVFNSLNEYINAPTGSLEYVHAVLDEEENLPTASGPSNIQAASGLSESAARQVLVNNTPEKSEVNLSEHDVNTAACVAEESSKDYQDLESRETLQVTEPLTDNDQDECSCTEVAGAQSSTDGQGDLADLRANNAPADATAPCELDIKTAESSVPTESLCTTIDTEPVEKETTECDTELPIEHPTEASLSRDSASEDVLPESPSRTLQTTEGGAAETEDTTGPEEAESTAQSPKVAKKKFEFSKLDEHTEEDLMKYLAELEEESKPDPDIVIDSEPAEIKEEPVVPAKRDYHDEDMYEAPIFESISIGDIPNIPQEDLSEKAKKFPIIDYTKPENFETAMPNLPEKAISDVIAKNSEDSVNLQCMAANGEKESNDLTATESLLKAGASLQAPETRVAENDASNLADTQDQPHNRVIEQATITDAKTLQIDVTQEDQDNITDEPRTPPTNEATHASESRDKTKESSLESSITESSDTTEKPNRPQTLDIVVPESTSESLPIGLSGVSPLAQPQSDIDPPKDDCQGSSPDPLDSSLESNLTLGKQPPIWVPDCVAASCMLCDVKFTMIKRRHHCRACGKVFCNKCCNLKYKLEYEGSADARVCVLCYQILTKAESEVGMSEWSSGYSTYANNNDVNSPQGRQPNPNNPMEYCSTIPPLQQLAGGLPPPPTVMVPVGVLKRVGGTKHRTEGSKSVMFSDGIRPGCDLTELDMTWDELQPVYRKPTTKKVTVACSSLVNAAPKRANLPRIDPITECYVPQDPNGLPPTVTIYKGQVSYHAVTDEEVLYRSLRNDCQPPVMFAINRNLYAYAKITNLNCCVNKICWNVTSRGLACVGQDEVILLVETLPDETRIPKDLLIFINQLYVEAMKGNTVSELGFAVYQGGNLLSSREHAGFLFIRQTLQCLQKIVLPPAPFLVGLLVHRWETPWAKVFPLRLLLRLGAEYRYYPCPLVSVRFRDALYFEIGHTVMKVLADFRNYSYTLPGVRGLTIHLRNRMTDVMLPRNRYDQVIKGLNNSNDHVLAYASNFSIAADSHLVCIQTNTGDESNYQTQAINIQNKPRTVTGASFIVVNGALKSSMGLSAKSSIVEDGLMVEIMPEKMEALKAALKNMQDFSIGCGRQGAPEPDETVNIKWVDNDVQFNLGVKSPIDGQLMDGIPSIRVHNGTDYKGTSRFIRWTEVFIVKSDDHPTGVHDPVDINKLSGNIAKATCTALVKLLDLLATAGLTKLAVRTTIHPDNVGYEAGSEGTKLPPIYMNSLDNELIQVLHKAAQSSQDTHTVLELIFYVLDD